MAAGGLGDANKVGVTVKADETGTSGATDADAPAATDGDWATRWAIVGVERAAAIPAVGGNNTADGAGKTDVGVGAATAAARPLIAAVALEGPPRPICICCIFLLSLSFWVSANFTTRGAEQPSIVVL